MWLTSYLPASLLCSARHRKDWELVSRSSRTGAYAGGYGICEVHLRGTNDNDLGQVGTEGERAASVGGSKKKNVAFPARQGL